jgi:hypothetical protein
MSRFVRSRVILAAAALIAAAGLVTAPADAAYSPQPREAWSANRVVFAVASHGDRIYIGGRFTRVGNLDTGERVQRTRVAAFDAGTGELIRSFDAVVDGDVRGIAVSDDGSRVFLGGTFTTVNGSARARLAAVDRSGRLVADWSPSASGAVRDLLVDGNDLFIAGRFGKVDGKGRGGLAKLDVESGSVSSWRVPTGGGRPWAISISADGSDLVVAGSFSSMEGQPRDFLGAATVGSGAVTPWHPVPVCDTCELYDVTVSGDGVFGGVGGPGGRATRWSATTGQIAWSVRGDGNVQAVAVADGVLYAGGHFGPTFAGRERHQLAAIDASGGRLLSWDPSLGGRDKPGVWALDAGRDFLHVGGGFRHVAGAPQSRFAAFPSA